MARRPVGKAKGVRTLLLNGANTNIKDKGDNSYLLKDIRTMAEAKDEEEFNAYYSLASSKKVSLFSDFIHSLVI